MPGRHRKPGSAARRIARTGAFAVIAGAPLLVSGTALAAPSHGGHAPEKRADHGADHDADDEEEYSYGALFEDEDERPEDEHYEDGERSSDDEEHEGDAGEGDTREAAYGSARRGGSASRAGSSSGSSTSEAHWDRLAECESSQDWNADTGNGYRGGLQFSDSTWRQYGGRQYAPTADQASREEQIAVARKVQREQGWNAWPSCSRQLDYA